MASALDYNNSKRLREVLLRHPKPEWPFPTVEDALALVAFLQRLNQERRNAQVGKRVRTLSENVEPLWRTYTPRQWEHFRSMLQNILRQFRAISNVEALLPSLALVAAFGVKGHVTKPHRDYRFGKVVVDERSQRCFAALEGEARGLQRRYADAGDPGVDPSDACFWFLQRPGHSEGVLSVERLHLLSHDAQDALLEHVKYIASLKPLSAIHELPRPDQLLVNAELGASYIKIKEAVSACRLPREVNAQYDKILDFPYITTLPLELVFELMTALEIAAEQGHKPTLAHVSGTAAVNIYTRRVDAVVPLLGRTFIRPQDIVKWKEEYLLPLKGWNGAGWSPSEMAAEWAELQRVENELIVGALPSMEDLPKHALAYRQQGGPFSLAHGYTRISHRMARRIGTSKEAWEAMRTTRGF